MTKTLENLNQHEFPFYWADLDYYPNTAAIRKEIYLAADDVNAADALACLFNTLFNDIKQHFVIYYSSWWDFCLDTWDPNKDGYNYEFTNKSEDSRRYLEILKTSGIELGYSGCCRCNNYDQYLPVVLTCITTQQAPYSPIFCDVKNEFFFYFHHTGSIGIYYKTENEVVKKIVATAALKYEVVSII